MCGRFTLAQNPADLMSFFGLAEVPELQLRYNIAPSQPVAVIRVEPADQRRYLSFARWGLIPSWTKDPQSGHHPINARSETAAEKPTFREALRYRRCLIPADGFYEWKKTGAQKVPMRFTHRDDKLFAFAGLWERWKDPDGSTLDSCVILTTEPNELVAPVHDRMPAILLEANYQRWLSPSLTAASEILQLLAPYPDQEMKAYPVGTLVNSALSEGSDLIRPAPGMIPGDQLSLLDT